ncbi:MAG: PHP domain-containing protein [Sporolactobacillus sp.]
MIDLHCHTSISDNSYSIEDVLNLAKKNKVNRLAITDHDTTFGLKRAIHYGEQVGVEVIPGIEISGYDFSRDRRAHILGLFIVPGHPALETLCRPMRLAREQAAYKMVEKVIRLGYAITWEQAMELAKNGTNVYKQHIMHALIQKGYTKEIYGDLYRELFSRGSETSEQGKAYVAVRYLDAAAAIRAIRAAGGVPILAHPGQFDNFSAVPEWVRAGLEGIEVYHPLNNHQSEERAGQLASKYNLVISGGSDFHGFYTDTGSTPGSRGISEDAFEAIKKRAAKIRALHKQEIKTEF